MVRFSANVGFLWPELPLPDRIRAAGRAGFAAVEFHFPYAFHPDEIRTAIDDAGVTMLGLNTALGANGPADFGVTARPGREGEARAVIDQAIDYAAAIGAAAVNVVAGTTGGLADAELTYRQNLAYACERGAPHGLTMLIEPLSPRSAPGAHVTRVEDALATIDAVGADNLKLMLDCFHTQLNQGDLTSRLAFALDHLGHVQIAAVPDRGEPDDGEIDYPYVLGQLDALGYTGWVGAEYHPRTTTDAGLGWRDSYTDGA